MQVRTIRERLSEYCAHSRYPIQFAYLFGSHARGQALPFSDVDIAVYLDERRRRAHDRIFARMFLDIARTLHTDDLDLVFLNDAPTRFAFNIIKGQLLYSKDERTRVGVETNILCRYPDEDAASEVYNQYLHRRIHAGKMRERTLEMVDAQLVDERLTYIQKMVRRLERFRQMDRERFVADEDSYEMAAYELQTSIEAMTDICTHVIAALGLDKPSDRRDAPLILARHGLLPKDLGENLGAAVSLRNKLVHGYLEISRGEMYDTIQNDLGDFDEFSEYITSLIEKQVKKRQAKPKKRKKTGL